MKAGQDHQNPISPSHVSHPKLLAEVETSERVDSYGVINKALNDLR